MTAALVLDTGLALLVLAVAVWTVAAGPAFSAVVGFVTFGLLLSLVWVRLAAVDVALTEAAIGSGVTGVLFIGAAARLRGAGTNAAQETPTGLTRLFAACLCLLVAAALDDGCGRRPLHRFRIGDPWLTQRFLNGFTTPT